MHRGPENRLLALGALAMACGGRSKLIDDARELDPSGNFGTKLEQVVGRLALGDLNEDGGLDAAFASGVINVVFGNGNSGFKCRKTYAAPAERFTLGDIDGDGRTDIVTPMDRAVSVLSSSPE